jgi:hypothetical protein
VYCGGLLYHGDVSNSLVINRRIRLMAMITTLNKVRIVEMNFSFIAAILENLDM